MNPEQQQAEQPDSPFAAGDGMAEEQPPDSGSPLDRLLDGNAMGPSIGELKADYDLPQHFALMGRGILRAAPGDGVPPIFDVFMGMVLSFMYYRNQSGGQQPEGGVGVVEQ